MKHLTEDQLYELAVKIATKAAFTEENVICMKHISQCDGCYQMMCCIIAMQDIALHLEDFAAVQETIVPPRITAVIHLAVDQHQPSLNQVKTGLANWNFDVPALLPEERIEEKISGIQKLEDVDDSQTYIAYDRTKKLLEIQISCGIGDTVPSVMIKHLDGEAVSLMLAPNGSTLRGEVHDLEDGDYQVYLSK
jgi:hypothetical protein